MDRRNTAPHRTTSDGDGFMNLTLIMTDKDAGEGTTRLAWSVDDGASIVEATAFSVNQQIPPDPLAARSTVERGVVCISSQAGCNVGCTFCASGLLKRRRNLTADEMIEQAVVGSKQLAAGTPRSVTFSGMGEPLQNLRAVVDAAFHLVEDSGAFEYASLSTVGIPRQIDRLAALRPSTNLFISLHGTTDERRKELIPSPSCFPIADVISAATQFATATSKRVKLSYLLLPGINDTHDDLLRLAEIASDCFMVQILMWNPVGGLSFQRASEVHAQEFVTQLQQLSVDAFVMASAGRDVRGGCGQLAGDLQAPSSST